MIRLSATLFAITLSLCACDRLGIPDPAKQAAMKEDEGKAIGAACRQSGRAIEDCFSLNRSALKAAVFAGWKDMNDYMAQNKIETAQPEADASSPTDDNADTSTSAPAAAKKKKITAIRPKK